MGFGNEMYDWWYGTADKPGAMNDYSSDSEEALNAILDKQYGTFKKARPTFEVFDEPLLMSDADQLIHDGIKSSANSARAAAWAVACGGMMDHSIAAAEAARRGDSYAMGGQILQAFASFTGIISTFGGPAGLAIGTTLGVLAGFASSLMAYFAPPQKSMDQIIKELLREERAKDIAMKLKSAAETFDNAAPALFTMHDNSHTFQEVIAIENFMTGPGELRLEDGHMWLVDEENQKLDVWDKVFVAYFEAVKIHLIDMLLASTKVKQFEDGAGLVPTESKTQMFATVWWMFQKLEKICGDLAPIVANRGQVWHVGENRRLYARGHAVGSGNDWQGWDDLAGKSDSIAVGAGDSRLWTVVRQDWVDRDVPYQRPGTNRSATFPYTIVERGVLRAGFAHKDSAEVAQNASHCSILRGPNGTRFVAVAGGSELRVRAWDEKLAGDVKWVGKDVDTIPLAGHTIFQVCGATVSAEAGGNPNVFTTTDRLYVLARTTAKEWFVKYTNYTPAGRAVVSGAGKNGEWVQVLGSGVFSKDVAGITADDEYLVAFGPTSIWRIRHADVATLTPWERIDAPDASFAEIGNDGDWWYQDVFACDDGSLLAVVKRKIYLYHSRSERWTRNEDADALKVFKCPVEGVGVFRNVHDVIDTNLKLFKTGADLAPMRSVLKKKGLLVEDKNGVATGLRPAWRTASS